MMVTRNRKSGFTLIELSIVLVIIGLLIGSVLAGQNLIKASEVRATVTQIEKYNTAVNTFREKYAALPGDLNQQVATAFGFASRGTGPGQGDGNGIITNGASAAYMQTGGNQGEGENVLFWSDLSKAALIEGSYITASCCSPAASVTPTSTPNLSNYYPAAKIGNGNFIYVWSGGAPPVVNTYGTNGSNYFGLASVNTLNAGYMTSSPGLTVAQASAIDVKMDDGLPQSGNVQAMGIGGNYGYGYWASGGTYTNNGAFPGPSQWAPVTSGECYDNGGVNGASMHYSVEVSNGSNVNCALSFRFQ